ncbi:P-loop containing nucleoside triphosphate hydrolase protein [Lobosporangium transversale]|uniref:DNA 3'-5' helicase n=1 Tax=Lobosporangium transversale TaxID=64571 RepID=A0A1Y2G5V5_9FUNG|nr:P-loop containing nucleoside triphosphate hydrolase protein [Lobosporangium transversale]XP_021875523.1 P-loop containing nucleoside triphosphate hydrolase protein [Lobosporangium transversale]ORY96100.1 P-loop containing nucleoside triphosphate hydrolase protein [Lobosporangium transversale]ORY96104.1 P-loop containing nucleoside triphosphate hydrolase protein [Lobosporangium transversale]|eukprot:XP_021875519.1 P-loop containing nucleoside triphosphate hydrolase protein [Lobosporangium transversale]
MITPEIVKIECERKFGLTPKEDQIKVIQCIDQGTDCVLIAPCGWGKTLVYFLPPVLWLEQTILIISPLKATMWEQSAKLNKLEIRNVALSAGDQITSNEQLVKDLSEGIYRAVFVTPELLFESDHLKGIWRNKRWQQQLLAVIVDDAHVVSTWGDKFREAYSMIFSFRPTIRNIPFIAVSATLPKYLLGDVTRAIRMEDPLIINLGNDRPNIRYEVKIYCRKKGERYSHFNSLLNFKKKTIAYFDAKNEMMGVFEHLKSVAGSNASKIDVFHANLSEEGKIHHLERFAQGEILLLLSTEAAGMGCDIGDIDRVVQVGVPDSVVSLVQRLGRAARDPQRKGVGIVLVADGEVNSKLSKDAAVGRAAPKRMKFDQAVNDFINTKLCRRAVLNNVFQNPPGYTEDCCDLCRPCLDEDVSHNDVLKRAPKWVSVSAPRTAEQKRLAKDILVSWRLEAFNRDLYPICSEATPSCVLPEKVLEKLGDNFGKITDTASINELTIWTPFFDFHLSQVAGILKRLNADINDGSQLRDVAVYLKGSTGDNHTVQTRCADKPLEGGSFLYGDKYQLLHRPAPISRDFRSNSNPNTQPLPLFPGEFLELDLPRKESAAVQEILSMDVSEIPTSPSLRSWRLDCPSDAPILPPSPISELPHQGHSLRSLITPQL